ncbi:MAG: alpha/beta hydrolase [Alphaproteobacteria bacterium]
MWKWVLRIALGFIAVIVVLGGAFLANRAYRQNEAAKAVAIDSRNGIQEAHFVTINGHEEWISIRGQDRSNPILVMVDGGPGAASSVFVPYRWEQDFTIVEWDQPGAGRSFAKAGGKIDPSLSIEEMAQDGVALAQYLREHLHKSKIGVFASSWGSIIGIHMMKLKPDLFYAYVGTGQTVSFAKGEILNYQHVLAKAHARGDKAAIAELEHMGPPPYKSETDFRTQRKWAAAYEKGGPDNAALIWSLLYEPDFSLTDASDWVSAFLASNDHFFGTTMQGPAMQADLTALGPEFAVPVFIFQGTEDDYAPFDLARSYFDSLSAPEKAFVGVPDAGHYASFSHPDEIRALLLKQVRPLAVTAN